MASAAEQLLGSLNIRTLARSRGLGRRVLLTLAALAAARAGTYVPLPGIDPQALARGLASAPAGALGLLDMFSGGAVERMAVCALGIMPFVSASIVIQLLGAFVPALASLKRDGEAGRRRLATYTRLLTVLLAAIQALGVVRGLQAAGMAGSPGIGFTVQAVASLVGGTMFLMWLGESITARGIGNGISLIIMAGILAHLPATLAAAAELVSQGAVSVPATLGACLASILLVAFVVLMERAQRRMPVDYPRRAQPGGAPTYLPLKLNFAGVIPPIFASALLVVPGTLAVAAGDGAMSAMASFLGHGRPGFIVAYGALIAFFAFFYTAVTFDARKTSDDLRTSGAYLPGVRPGDETAAVLDRTMTRLTVIGAAYMLVVCLVPQIASNAVAMPFQVGGTSVLIVVSVTLETVAQVHAHLMAGRYEDPAGGTRIIGRPRGAAAARTGAPSNAGPA